MEAKLKRPRGMKDGGVKLKYPESCPLNNRPCTWKKYRDCQEDKSKCMANPSLFSERFKARFMEGESLVMAIETYRVNGVMDHERNHVIAIMDEAKARNSRNKKAVKKAKMKAESDSFEAARQRYINYTKRDK